jgi:serine/threonine protein phosphatase 1
MSQLTQRRIVIGDVHGHYDGLMTLLEMIAAGSGDQVYFLGDLIDRGPQSAQIVEFVRQSSYACLLGNHEQLLLESFPRGEVNDPAMQAWLYSGGRATISSYNDVDLLMEHMQWIRTLPLYLDLDDLWLVHAGVHPEMPIDKQTSHELCWIREDFHSIRTPYFTDKLIITGHTITFTLPGVAPGELAQGRGWLDIDTGAYHPRSGWLTGVDMTHRKAYQVNVMRKESRVLPLDEAITQINPANVMAHRQAMRL